MRVAIIGAGVAGLSCAHELEKHGVSPVIFEKKSFIGEQFPYVSSFLEIIHRPIKDSVKYINDEFGMELQPLNTINKLVHHSPNRTAVVEGKIGYFFNNSQVSNDLKMQIYSKLRNSTVVFEKIGEYEKLSKEFDKIVIANGRPDFAKELGCWIQWFDGFLRGAKVIGEFDPNTLVMWINKDYAKGGYAYLSPFDSRTAAIVLVLPDATEAEVDVYWNLFLHTEKIKYKVVEEYKVRHQGGLVNSHKVEDLYFVGNAGGAIDTFLGFGQFNSIFMGAMAARSIVNGENYETLIAPIIKKNMQFYQFRKAFNDLTNTDYDNLISYIEKPGVKQVLYNSSLNVVEAWGATYEDNQ